MNKWLKEWFLSKTDIYTTNMIYILCWGLPTLLLRAIEMSWRAAWACEFSEYRLLWIFMPVLKHVECNFGVDIFCNRWITETLISALNLCVGDWMKAACVKTGEHSSHISICLKTDHTYILHWILIYVVLLVFVAKYASIYLDFVSAELEIKRLGLYLAVKLSTMTEFTTFCL